MKTYRSIERIISASAMHMVGDGFRVHSFFPGNGLSLQRMSPFLLLDYNPKFDFPPSDIPKGVGVHPHRGFETVTLAYQGSVAHHDSAGNSGVIHPGDIQWMTAASGILHKEYHETEFSRKGGSFQMVQLWVNLPKENKMSPPKYQAITHAQKGRAELANNAGHVNVIAGTYQDVKGPASTFTPIEMYDIHLNPGGRVLTSSPQNFNTALLVIEGRVNISGELVGEDHLVIFNNDAGEIEITAEEKSIALFLSGQPIDEPIAHYGPFVMNTRKELQEAFADYSEGRFGFLKDD